MLAEAMRPVDVRIDAERVRGIDEAEEVRAARPRALQIESSIKLVFAPQRLVQPRMQRILMAAVENGDLVVVERIAADVRQRIKLQSACA